MEQAPPVDEVVGRLRQTPLVNDPGLDLDQRLVLSVDRVKMGGRMVAVVKPDDDPVEAADLRPGRNR